MAPQWLAIPGVEAVGIGADTDGGLCIIVSTSLPVEQFREHLPREVDGVPVHLQFSGEFSIGN